MLVYCSLFEILGLIVEPKNGIWISEAGNLSATHIFHINTHLAQKTSDGWEKMIANCLKECDKRNVRSIAFPAIGTGEVLARGNWHR